MPIRANLRPLYPSNWPALSRHVRFIRAAGRCQACARPHATDLRCLPDGRWFDAQQNTWRNRRGRPAPWPDLLEATQIRTTRVSLATAHLDHDPTHNRLRNLRSLCQRCHLSHDRAHHLVQRRLTYRSRDAIGDLWLGVYADAARAPDPAHSPLTRTAGPSHTQSQLTVPACSNPPVALWNAYSEK